jgi:hypothetical protein
MKSILKSIIITGLFVCSFQIAIAQEPDKTVSITASGSGKTQDEAKQTALRSAIEQAFGAFISSKTEILNDQIVSDQIASVASGNIKSFTILHESQLPDGSWGVTLKVIVSVSKLTSFVEAKGVAIEIKGGMFALNIKQQLLNEQAEINAISQMVGLLHEPLQRSFDYIVKSADPISLDEGSKMWAIPILVTATANMNIEFCANYCIKTLTALSLSPEEVKSYLSLKKNVFPVHVKFKGVDKVFYLRKQISINALNMFTSNWEFYTRLYTLQSGLDTISGFEKPINFIHKFDGSTSDYDIESQKSIIFLSYGSKAATFQFQDKRTLKEIEKMTGYLVKPLGVISKYKFGGFVIEETNSSILILAITALSNIKLKDAKDFFDEISLNGYNDWRLPTYSELKNVYNSKSKLPVSLFSSKYHKDSRSGDISTFFWSYNNEDAEEERSAYKIINFIRGDIGWGSNCQGFSLHNAFAVRTFQTKP